MRKTVLIGLVAVVWLAWPRESVAQKMDGCSLGGWSAVIQAGLDTFVLKACTRHDVCWWEQGHCDHGFGEAFPGFGHKAACDTRFWLELNAVCTGTTSFLAASGLKTDEEVKEFAENCFAAALAGYAGVSLNLWDFADIQCKKIAPCNPGMCRFLGDRKKAESCCPAGDCSEHPGGGIIVP